MALLVFQASERANDLPMQAEALSLMANCENLLGRRRSAQKLSTRAAQLFQSLGNLDGEATALAALSNASSALGHNESAVEAALLALELSKLGSSRLTTVSAHAQLGHALTNGGSFDEAREALVQSKALAKTCGSALDELVALVRQGASEALRVVTVRHETGHMPPLEPVQVLLKRFERFEANRDMAALAMPDQMPIQVFLKLVSGLFKCWIGAPGKAREALDEASEWLAQACVAPWLQSFEALLRCELLQDEQNPKLAEVEARRMLTIADALEQEQAALLGHLLVCRTLELQGKMAQALTELKAMAARERRIRIESLTNRHEVVRWQLDIRRIEQSRIDLQASTSHFEKLAFEDALTGIANRRRFESTATNNLRHCSDEGKKLCVALLDIDHFKQINDHHTHLVGDKVLQVIAQILTAHVRVGDLAARLAGDEFVILFGQTDARFAWEACERLRDAISRQDWGVLSAGLAVDVSIGVAESCSSDSVETLLRRSDLSMYERKNSKRAQTYQVACPAPS